ncbi:hypothetical protein ACIQU6_40915 [Streptomyces sp. NPDC090442]|uniref:hypothetical protein n=1 Tax=Streptomyces sp. NPDC090442 TaxID=3365962 RepID=UPI0038131FFC
MTRLPSCTPRFVLIALLSYDGQAVLLCRPGGAEAWRPVHITLPEGHTVAASVRRWVRCAYIGEVRWGSVTGRLRVPRHGVGPLEAEVVIVKATAPVGAGQFGASACWWPLARLPESGVALFPMELGLLLQGYVEGWIPDGEITLDA